jgi:hypothetical protein
MPEAAMSELTEKLFRAMDRARQGREFKGAADLELLWGDVLEAILLGEEQRATEACSMARQKNGYLEAYLLGRRKLPKQSPESYTWGSSEQAACAAFRLVPAWAAHPTAVAWLKARR